MTIGSRTVMFSMASPGGIGPIELDKVFRVCLAMDAELELFHCIYDASVSRPARFGTRGTRKEVHGFVRWRRRQLERSAEWFRSRGLRVSTSVRWDYPAHEGIVRQVLRHKPGLLIAQSTRKGRMERFLVTGTDYKLIEICPCPVLFIKTGRPYSDPVIVAAVGPDRGTALDEAILDSAGAICEALSGKLLVFHARPHRSTMDDAEKIDEGIIDLARQRGMSPQQVRIVEGGVAGALPRFVDQEMADIVVMGVASRLPLRRALVGHTAERVLDALDCDIWIVKPPGFRCPVGQQPMHQLMRLILDPAATTARPVARHRANHRVASS